MGYILGSLFFIWVCGLLFLAGLLLNDVRVIYNNLLPGTQPRIGEPWRPRELRWWHAIALLPLSAADIVVVPAMFLIGRAFGHDRISFRIAGVNPALLNETGLAQQKKAIRHEWITVAWAIGGVVLISWTSSWTTS
jgi:hypothetical protein